MSDIYVTVTRNQNCRYFKGLRAGELILCSKAGAQDGGYTAQLPGSGALGNVSGRIFSKNDEKSIRKLMRGSRRPFYAQVIFCAGDALVCKVIPRPKRIGQKALCKKISLAV
jgi:hypothetical protein